MDDVIFAHKQRLLDVATQLKCSAHTQSLWLDCKLCAVIPTDAQDYFLVAESVAFDCLVINVNCVQMCCCR